jgi:ATP-dependent DNA helicase RecG
MMADASPRPGDGQVLDGFSEVDLNPESLAAYRGLFASLTPSHPFLTGDTQALLRQLGGWNRDRERGNEGLTLAGLLMFGQQRSILDRLPHFHLDYQQLPVTAGGDNPRWIDRVTLDGTWSGNLFDFYRRVFPRLRDGLQLRFQLGSDQHRRDDTPQVQALREAFTNALIHADYEGSGGIRIRRRSTGFEFINPGQLRMPIEQVHEGGRSDCRNPSLQTMFQMIGVGEKAGSGFPKIDQAWKEQHWRSPLLEEDLELDEIRLRLTTESLLPDEVMAELERKFPGQLAAIDEVGRVALATAAIEGHVTNRRLQDLSDRHGRDLTMLLQDLCLRGFLKKAGRTTATTYTISDGQADSGQSDASLGQSGPSLGQSDGSLGQSSISSGHESTELGDPVSVVAASPHAPRELVKTALLVLCKDGYRTSKELATVLNRDPIALRKRHLAQLVKEGVLELQFPDANDPRQAYRTKAGS